ncbi:hypothetical protein [Streptomyces sp. NPDC001286]
MTTATTPKLTLPLQARAVRRDDWPPAGRHQQGGVAAARSGCADLPGAARQLCYVARHGVAT